MATLGKVMKRDKLSAKREKRLISSPWSLERSMIVGMYVLAVSLRTALFSIYTKDYNILIGPWFNFIQYHGRFAALKYEFSGYNVSSLYLLTIATYIPLPGIITMKLISVYFDILLALFTYLIVKLKYGKSYIPIIAALVTLFTPAVFINSGLWGQCDSIYASFSLGGLYFLLRKQPFWAFLFFGLAVSFKPQAIFLFPLLFVLLLAGKVRLRYFFIIPLIYLIVIWPAYLIGRDFMDLLTIYLSLAGKPSALTLNAPSILHLIPVPEDELDVWKNAGIILALSAVMMLSFVVLTSKRKITNDIMIKLALVFVLIVPFLLPEMYDRYFYLTDIISVIYAFYFKKYFYLPILIQVSSLLSYIPFLVDETVIDPEYLSLLTLGVIIIVIVDLVKTLTASHDMAPGEAIK